jgi:hypothetical protein
MPITSDLLGSYSNQIQGITRTLTIASQDNTAQTISGTWASSINGVATTFPVQGTFLPAMGSPGSNALYFTVAGHAQTSNTSQQPPVMRAIDVVTGFAEVSGPGKVDRLYITITWTEDSPGNLKSTSAWTGQFLTRH